MGRRFRRARVAEWSCILGTVAVALVYAGYMMYLVYLRTSR